jgi:molybdopterin converting factor small subunit
MSATIEISSIFAPYTDNNLKIAVQGKTVGECIQDLVGQFPKLKKILLDKDGNLMRSYDVFINGESAYPMEMKKPVRDGDKLNIIFLIHGG